MLRSVPLFVGLRYFTAAGRGNLLVSFISLLAIAGMALGVGLLVVVLSVMNGFDRELREKILSVVPHIQLLHNTGVSDWQGQQQLIAELDNVTEVSPYNQLEGLLYNRQDSRPLQLLGLADSAMPSGMESMLADASLALPKGNAVLLSASLAESLDLVAGQQVAVIVPAIEGGQAAAFSMQLAGIFATHTELDQVLGLTSLEQVAKMNGSDNVVQGFRVQIDQQFDARQIGYRMLDDLPYGYGFRDWFQTHGNLYQAIQLSRNMVGLLIFLIVAIAAFNVVSMLMMSVVSKRKDIAVLQTMGLSEADILKLFLFQGTLIGLFGIALGVVVGLLGCYWLADLVGWLEMLLGGNLLNTAVYPIDYIPVDVRWLDVATIAAVAMVLNMLATLYPARRASRVAPADELRYDG
ncbi:MAG: FtsX-like permease family protein [Porticoccaceae bacterium]